MRMKRIHSIELTRYYQRLENEEKRRKKTKPSLLKRILSLPRS